MKIFVNFIVAGPATHVSCNRLAWFVRCPLFITRPVDTMWQLWVQVYWSRDLSRSVSLLARRHADRGFLCGTKSSETVLFTRVGVECFTGCITFSIVPFSLSPVYFLFTFSFFYHLPRLNQNCGGKHFLGASSLRKIWVHLVGFRSWNCTIISINYNQDTLINTDNYRILSWWEKRIDRYIVYSSQV